jgi:hypothetical protein
VSGPADLPCPTGWTVERVQLARPLPFYDDTAITLVGQVTLTNAAGCAIHALVVGAITPLQASATNVFDHAALRRAEVANARHPSDRYPSFTAEDGRVGYYWALYWERNASPPCMRFLPLVVREAGLYLLDAPLPPR